MAGGLIEHGARVWLAGRDAEALARTAAELGPAAVACPLDVSDLPAASAALQRLLQAEGRLDVLVNNVGQRHRAPLSGLPAEALRELMEVNLVAGWHLCREAAGVMARQGAGSIINVTSIAGPIARAGDAAYTTTKGALAAMTRALAAELGPQGVRVNAIAPGFFATETNQGMVADAGIPVWAANEVDLYNEVFAAAAAFGLIAAAGAGTVTENTILSLVDASISGTEEKPARRWASCVLREGSGTIGTAGLLAEGSDPLKARAAEVVIEGNSFDDANGRTTNYMIDRPAGSVGRIADNWFVQGRDKENYSAFIALGAEDILHPSAGLRVENNEARFVPGLSRNSVFLADWTASRIVMQGNKLAAGIKQYDQR